jgi:hypothetical protein
VFRSDCEPSDFIRYVLLDLGVDISGMDQPTMHEALNRILREEMEAGRQFVLVVDEAQNLQKKTLEAIRLLSNFETPWMKLMVIVLVGQPEFANRLASPSLAQLRQRISMMIRISPFAEDDVNAYIDHRLWAAGGNNPSVFTSAARELIAERSEGIPRNINNICFNAMSLGCALRKETIDVDVIEEALADLDLTALMERKPYAGKSKGKASREPTPDFEFERQFAPEAEREDAPYIQSEVTQETQISGLHGEPEVEQSAAMVSEPAKPRSAYGKWVPRFAIASALLLALGGSARELNRGELHTFEIPMSRGTASVVPTADTTETQTKAGPDDRSTYSTGDHDIDPARDAHARLKVVKQDGVQRSTEQSSDTGK